MAREKCAPDDPRRCEGKAPDGQCQFLAESGEIYCEKHLGVAGRQRKRRQKVERYLIDQQELSASYKRQQDDRDYLDMKDEILLLQALLEQKINSIGTKAELITAIPGINALVQRLESMKSTLLKMQRELGKVLGKEALRDFIKELGTILDEELVGIENKGVIIERIADRICDALEEAGKASEDLHGED